MFFVVLISLNKNISESNLGKSVSEPEDVRYLPVCYYPQQSLLPL